MHSRPARCSRLHTTSLQQLQHAAASVYTNTMTSRVPGVTCRVTFPVFVVLSLLPRLALAQTPPTPPPPPPPEREGSAEFAFVGTTGNSSTQTISLGGELIYRPSPWETKVKVSYVRNQTEDELRAQAFALTIRGQRPIQERLSAYGQYGYQRDRFGGHSRPERRRGRHRLPHGSSQAPHKLIVDGGLGYANEQRLIGNRHCRSATLGGGVLYTLKISDTSELSEDAHLVFSLSDGQRLVPAPTP